MKTFKKILCTLLIVVMCLTSAPLQGFVGMEWPSLPEISFDKFELSKIDFSSWFGSLAKATTITDQCGDNVYYTYDTETQELVVSGSGAIWDYEMGESPASNVVIKSVIIEEGITVIGKYAFYDCDELINVDIREGLIEVGYGAFMNCQKLTDIIAPASIATVGEAAFYGCENLKNLYFCGTVEQSQNVYFNAYNNELLNSYIHFNYYDYTHISTSQTIKEASCFEEGKVIYMCQCGGVYYITLPETNHTDKDNNACCDVCSLEASSNGYCGESVFWNIYDETQLVISGSGEINNFSENNSPFYNSNIKNVIIENGITSIGIGAFSCCSKLTSIILPDSVTMIGDGAFGGCSNLVSITIPNSVTIIGADAFAGCSNLTSLSLPKNINCIEEFAFANCVSLADIIIPDSVKIIETCAFGGCSNLVNITIPNSVEIIGYCAFVGCTSLTNIIIPDSVTMIEDQAFEGCDNLINVSFVGDGLVDLDGRVFDNCINLSSVYIGESKPKISYGNFLGCNNLNRFIVTETNAEYSTDDKGVLFDKNKKNLIMYPKGKKNILYNIPNSVTNIGSYAFYDCVNLTNIIIPDSITNIGSGAFQNCTSLASITVPDGVTNIGDRTFDECTNLTSIIIPDSITNIGSGAFQNCTSLANITIPDSVTTIDRLAFYNCINLASITIPGSVTNIGHHVFFGCKSLTNITIPDGVTNIGENTFAECTNLTSIKLPKSITSIGQEAFYGCKNLTNITIPDSVTTIGNGAFSFCHRLTNITIPDSVTTIGASTFYDCYSLTSVTIGDSVTTIGVDAFASCDSLTSITIPDSVTTIGNGAFRFCHRLTNITIPDSVTTIGRLAFYNCDSLTSITVDANNTAYTSDYRGVLFNKNKTTLIQYPIGNTSSSYIIPYSVTTIGDDAFSSCDSLTNITIPDSVTTIGEDAFASCDSLTSITIPDSVTTIGAGAFYDCYSLTDVYYSGTKEQWEKISIYYPNQPLTNATIHFNSNGAEVTTGYKREHVVDNWKNLNQSYKSGYLEGFGVPIDGTNGNPDYLIPGQSENMIPQGLTYWPEKDWVLVSSYDKSKENPSAIFALDRETGVFVAQFNLKKENGKDWKPHAGGIGVSEHNLYITCDRGVAYFPLSDLDVPSGTVKDIKRADYVNFGQLGFGGIVEDVFDVYTAYVNVSDGILWAGNFYSNYPGWSREELIGELIGLLPKSWDNPAALDYNSLVLGFKLSGDNSEDEWNNLKAICDSATYRIGIDNDMQCIQGIAFKKVEGKKYRMYLSRTTNVSFGAEITVADITLNKTNLEVSKDHCEGFKNLPGTEGIVFIDNDLHILYESGALSYAGSLGWGTYKDLTDVIWKVNENDLLGLIGVRYEGLLNHMGIKYDYDYSDSYFEDSSLNYDHDLAIASYCLAISSMVKEGTGKDGKYGTEELDAARKFFSVTEFDNCQPYGYDKKPTSDSIACVIGHKNVVLKGQEETIIAIGIRGAGYGSEWSGNFRLGNSTDHAGFAEARRLVMKYLEQYIEKFGSSFNSNLKFWVTGYSRAAATANLVAATLNNDGDLNGASFKFVNDIKDRYSIGDVYAYTFETPLNTTSKEASAAKYNNIYNFINRIDYVPKVAPSAWDYTRYGENLYMPSLETEGTRYYEYLDEMKKEYEKMTGDKYKENFDFYEVGFFMEGHNLIPDDISITKVNGYISQSEFLDELIDIVANDVVISADNYVENYEVAARKLMPVIMDGSLDLEITWKDILDELSFLEVITGKTENMIVRVLAKKIAGAMAVSGLSYDEAYDFLGILDELVSASANNFDYVYTLIENATNIKPAHEPSVNFAWLVSIEPELENALEDGDWYLKFVYNCPIDIALYDENGELLATIIDDKVVFPDDRYLTVYVDSDGQKCFCLPNNTEYRFEILGTDEGTMTCSVSKYDFTENKTTEILNYYDIPVEDGTELTMTVNETIEEELTEKVEITDSEEKIVNYDDHLESEEIETFNVSVTTDTENSYVSGGGTYYKGEYAQVEAVEVGCNKFIGWYIDNTCISTELKYRHPVTESVVIEARFSEKHSMGEWYEILPAACETIGNEQRDCSECDYFETQEIPAVEHNYEAVITPATCYSNGFTTNTCTKCGNGYTFDITAMLTHNFSGWYIVTPATCEASGVEQRDCSACDYSETQNVPATGHNYNNGVCTSCGDDLTANCSCNCHAGGIKGLIFKIILFFQKLFRMNQICEGCGVSHY